MKNWGRNLDFAPKEVIAAQSTDHVQHVVQSAAKAGRRVKAIGSGHSFSPIGVPDDIWLTMKDMDAVLDVDYESNRVHVQSGIVLHDLNRQLLNLGLALPNLGDIDQQTISGAVSTSTHGTGANKFGIGKAVVGVKIVTANGELLQIDENHPYFQAARVSLGALGVVTEVTLQCVPAFLLHAAEEPMLLSQVTNSLDSLINENDHFEFYWWPHTEYTTVKRNNLSNGPILPLGKIKSWIDDEFAANGLFELMARAGNIRRSWVPKINRIAGKTLSAREYTDHSFKVFISPRRVHFCEMEYALPRETALSAIEELHSMISSQEETIGFPVEVRFTAADDVWMSTSYGRDSVYIAIHMYHRQDHKKYFSAAEKIFQSHGGRPHWGKMNYANAEYLSGVYPKFAEFVKVRNELDPDRMFSNDYLERVLGK